MLTVVAAFTKTTGVPATGLTLAEIDLYLTAIAKANGAATVIWDGSQHPSAEIATLGMYMKQYASEDVLLCEYAAAAHYTGVTVLDGAWITAAFGENMQATRDAMKLAPSAGAAAAGSIDDKLDSAMGSGTGATHWSYELTEAPEGTGTPIADAVVAISTDLAGANIIAQQTTDASGMAYFWLDAGTYYLWRRKVGYTFTNPDTEIVA